MNKRSSDEIAETIDCARQYLQGTSVDPRPIALAARDFAEVLVQLSNTCLIGVPCAKHGDALHGQEAEELRAGVELILTNTAAVSDADAGLVLRQLRKSLFFLLDHVDARDSIGHLEKKDAREASRDPLVDGQGRCMLAPHHEYDDYCPRCDARPRRST